MARSTPDQPTLPGIDLDLQQKHDFAQAKSSANGKKAKTDSESGPANLGKAAKVIVPDFANPKRPKTCLEVDFPIVPINALSQLEGNAGKPIYQMSKWWARRRSSVFRAMLIAGAMQAPIKLRPDGSPELDADGIPVPDITEAAKAVWDVYYANHQKAGSFQSLKVLDCFMGGGTTLVEGSRLGFHVSGVDLNPVAWFVVKNELACTDPAEVRTFFDQIEAEVKPVIQPFYVTECPHGHKGQWLRLAGTDDPADDQPMPEDFDPLKLAPEDRKQYRYAGPEVIYTFWAKHGPCSRPGCGHRTPIFRSPVIAEKKLGVKYIPLTCKSCKTEFHAELGAARMAPAAQRIVLESESPFTELSQPFAQRLQNYSNGKAAEQTQRINELCGMVDAEPGLRCPKCREFSGQYLRDVLNKHNSAARRKDIDKKHLNIQPPRNGTKPVYCYLLIDPEWLNGASGIANEEVLGGYIDAPIEPTAHWFESRLNALALIEVRGRIKLTEDTSDLGITAADPDVAADDDERPSDSTEETEAEDSDRKLYGVPHFIRCDNSRTIDTRKGTVVAKATVACHYCGGKEVIIQGLRKAKHSAPVMPYALQCFCPECKDEDRIYDGRYFKAPSQKDVARLVAAYSEWEIAKSDKLQAYWPKDEIPFGWQTHSWSVPDHGYTHWYRMFNPRQLLVHATLLEKVAESGSASRAVREQALGAFQQYLRNQTMFGIWDISRDCMAPFFSNNHFVAKQLVVENCVFPSLGRGNWESCAEKILEGLRWCQEPWEPVLNTSDGPKSTKVFPGDPVLPERCSIERASSSDLAHHPSESIDLVITDPPFGDNFIYSEMANFFYAWLRLPLSKWHPEVCSLMASPHAQEAVKNVAHHPDNADDFYKNMMTSCWSESCRLLKPGGLMAFTFHHSEGSQWALVLEALFDSGFYLEAIYPVTSDESKGANAEFGSKKIEYDMLHVCRKRINDPTPVSWAKMRQWVKAELNRLKLLLAAYKASELSEADIRVILRGKGLEFYSRHYGQVFTSDNEPLSIGHALSGINQLLDEGTDGATGNPPSIVQPAGYQYLRLFTILPSRSADEITKSLFGTAIRQRDFEDRGWVKEANRRVTAMPILQRFETLRQRPRKEMKTEIDQAHFLIGSALPSSGVNLEQELSKNTWIVRRSVDAVLEWYAKMAPESEIREAAELARTILRQTLDKLRQEPVELDRQLKMFNDWDESESANQ